MVAGYGRGVPRSLARTRYAAKLGTRGLRERLADLGKTFAIDMFEVDPLLMHPTSIDRPSARESTDKQIVEVIDCRRHRVVQRFDLDGSAHIAVLDAIDFALDHLDIATFEAEWCIGSSRR